MAATLGSITLVITFGLSWDSYKKLLDEECVAPFRPPKVASEKPTAVARVKVGLASTRPSHEVPAPCRPAPRFDGRPHAAQSLLIVEAMPLAARVFLDRCLLGTAHEIIARAFPLTGNTHAIEVSAPGFRPYVARFTTQPEGFPTRIRVTLRPE